MPSGSRCSRATCRRRELGAFRCAEERDIALAHVERTRRRARACSRVRWPDPFPFDSDAARCASRPTRKSIGRAVAFSLAAFRQAFAGGRSLGEPDNVADRRARRARCTRPRCSRRRELRGVGERLEAATARAHARGVRDVPAVWDGERVAVGA